MSLPWLLTSPASRGIGFALTSHLLRTTNAPVVATARKDLDRVRDSLLEDASKRGADQLDEDRLHVLKVDVTDEDSVKAAADECASLFPSKTHHLHMALLVPGILHAEKAPAQIEYAHALHTFQINALGPLVLAKHFLPLLPRKSTGEFAGEGEGEGGREDPFAGLNRSAAAAALMGARVGSVSDNRLGGWFSYRASKAAVAQEVRSLDIFLRQSGAAAASKSKSSGGGGRRRSICLGLHPGTVRTDLSRDFWDAESVKRKGLLEPEDAAARLVDVVNRKSAEEGAGGKVWDYKGEEVPP